MRRLLIMPVAVVALISVIAVIGTAIAKGEGEGYDPASEQTYGLDYIPVRGERQGLAVRAILLRQGDKTFVAKTDRGVVTTSQHRLPLAALPLVGQLFGKTYRREDMMEENRIADVFAGDEALLLDFPPKADLPQHVVVLNRADAFALNDGFSEASGSKKNSATTTAETTADQTLAAGSTLIGGAYYERDSRRMLILIKPSIVTDPSIFR